MFRGRRGRLQKEVARQMALRKESDAEKEIREIEATRREKMLHLRAAIESYRVEEESDEGSEDLATISKTVVDKAEELLDILEPKHSSAVAPRPRASDSLGSLTTRGTAGRLDRVEEIGPANGDSSYPERRGSPLDTVRELGDIALPPQRPHSS